MTEHHHMAGKGACPHPNCVTATEPPAITADDMDNLRHALGIDPSLPRKQWGYRNRFYTSANDPSFARLVAAGFARNAGTINRGRDTLFCATADGCRAAGMTKAEIDRMEPRP